MTHDAGLAAAIRRLLDDEPDVMEKSMFGGRAFLVGGHMAVAANSRGDLMVRIDPSRADELTRDPRATRMVMQGRQLDGWLNVRIGDPAEEAAGGSDADLATWVRIGVEYATSLPPK